MQIYALSYMRICTSTSILYRMYLVYVVLHTSTWIQPYRHLKNKHSRYRTVVRVDHTIIWSKWGRKVNKRCYWILLHFEATLLLQKNWIGYVWSAEKNSTVGLIIDTKVYSLQNSIDTKIKIKSWKITWQTRIFFFRGMFGKYPVYTGS